MERQKRRRIRSAVEREDDVVRFADSAHGELFASSPGDVLDRLSSANVKRRKPESAIDRWWDRYLASAGTKRLAMVREKLVDGLDESWREALFPEAVFEAEAHSEPTEYVAFLETLANEHRELYDDGLLWFMRSRITHYLTVGDATKIEDAVKQDAAAMTETGDAFYGTLSMLRLAGLASPADTMAVAGLRLMDTAELMPWAIDELFNFFMDSQVRQCVADGGDAAAIAKMEAILEQHNANMDPGVVLMRAEMIRRLCGRTKTKWLRNQLVGNNHQSSENCCLLSFDFSHWLTSEKAIAPIAADELRVLVLNTLSRDGLTMRNYLDGVLQALLDQHLAGLLGFMSLDRFKAPATLIAVEHFAEFLNDTGLAKPKASTASLKSVHDLDSQLRRMLNEEWQTFAFLDSLRSTKTNPLDP